MVKEWMLAGSGWTLTGYTFSLELWTHVIFLGLLSSAVTYLNIEPYLIKRKLIKASILERVLK